jgi:PAS domain-containing protein
MARQSICVLDTRRHAPEKHKPGHLRPRAVALSSTAASLFPCARRPIRDAAWSARWLPDHRWRSVATALVMFMAAVASPGQPLNPSRDPLPTLTTARAAHSLPFDKARRGYPVRLRAVVTYYDPYTDPHVGAFFACDRTGCICVLVPPKPVLSLRAGTVVDLKGVSDPGNYAPIVVASEVSVAGQTSLPADPPRRNLTELLAGADDGNWVEVEGVVRSVSKSEHSATLTLALTDGVIRCITPLVAGTDYARLVDSRIVVRGNAAPIWTSNRQMIGARLLFSSLDQVRIAEPPPGDPFSLPVRPIPGLLRFEPDARYVHRVRVNGRVTLQWPGRWVVIQDDGQGLFIPTAQKTTLMAGDAVDVVGFPAMGDYALTLADAVFRSRGRGNAVAAQSITAQEAMKGNHDAQLIQIRGWLVNQDLMSDQPSLALTSGGRLFLAVFGPGTKTETGSWRVGSEMQLTGVCVVEVDKSLSSEREGAALPKSFRVLLRSPRDVEVLKEPSWWTASRIFVLLAICMVTILVGAVWVVALKRRVRERTETIRAALESTADGILVIDSAGKIVAHNQKFEEVWEVPEPILRVGDHLHLLDFAKSQLKDPEAFTRNVRYADVHADEKTDDVI